MGTATTEESITVENIDQPFELQVEVRLRDRQGHNLRHFSQFLTLEGDPHIYNTLLSLLLETLTQEQKGLS